MAGIDSGKKEFITKVSTKDGVYLGIWRDIQDDLEFTQQINTPGTTTTFVLNRSAQNQVEQRTAFTTQSGSQYTDSTGQPYFVTTFTSNTIGPDTDVMNGHIIEATAVYGNFLALTDHLGNPYTTSTGDPYVVSNGAPLGRVVFTGEIVNWEATYGDTEYVTVTVASDGMELTKGEPIKSGSATTVSYSSTPIEAIFKSILDTNPGRMTYDLSTIANTGVPITSTFQLNTKLEGIESAFDQTPSGWTWYGNVADRKIYLRPQNTVADHLFIRGKHLSTVKIKESAEDLRNRIYFLGGTMSDGSTLYRVWEDTASIAAYGLGVYKITDRRYTLEASAKRYADKVMSRYAKPVYTSTIEILASTYDIETIQLGDMIGFGNFGNFVDSQLLQVVSRTYTSSKMTLQIGEILDGQMGIITNLEEALSNEQYTEIPSTPL